MKIIQKVCVVLVVLLNLTSAFSQDGEGVSLDSIRLSDPSILADKNTSTYYMTGTGGKLWKSKDLREWFGPYSVTKTDAGSWMGPKPMIWAAELHQYKDKYYYFATFTNRSVVLETVKGNVVNRRASHVLVSDRPDGPYVPMSDATYLPAEKATLDGTFWWIRMASRIWFTAMNGFKTGTEQWKR